MASKSSTVEARALAFDLFHLSPLLRLPVVRLTRKILGPVLATFSAFHKCTENGVGVNDDRGNGEEKYISRLFCISK